MKLEPLPGAPGYMVDTDAMAAYSYKRGTLRRIKTKTIYRACNISVDGKVIGTTIYRMVYCVQRGIDITKIPKGVCIGVNQYGSITVVTRSEISEKASRTVEARRENLEAFRENYRIIDSFYRGDNQPLLDYVGKAEKEVISHYINVRGMGRTRAEIIVGCAVNKLLDRFSEGRPVFHIKPYLYRLAQGENENYAKRILEFIDQFEQK